MLRYHFFFVILLIVNSSLSSQVSNLNGPLSWHIKQDIDKSNIPVLVLPKFNLKKQLTEDSLAAYGIKKPYKFGKEFVTHLDFINNSGSIQVKKGKISRYEIISLGAISINLIFDKFFLAKGSHLHIYNKYSKYLVGAYTYKNNNNQQTLGTDIIKGDDIIIELYEPYKMIGQSILNISKVVHGYKDIDNLFGLKVNESGACNMDVICNDGLPWTNEIKSVARILAGGSLCTGTLINNTAEDGTPYFLTANHCGPQNMGSAVFRFNYDSPICGSQTIANSQAPIGAQQTINGSSFISSNSYTDFGLVLLNSTPPDAYDLCYAGWNKSTALPSTAVCIHHPSGDVKKISFDDDPVQTTSSSGNNNYLRVESWERNTTTEGGSSGSGLWDQNHYLVGQEYGGAAACGNSSYDIYGRFSISWTGNNANSSNSRLRDWLDPNNSGVSQLSSFCPNSAPQIPFDAGISLTGSSKEVYCSSYVPVGFNLLNTGTNNLSEALINVYLDNSLVLQHNWVGSLSGGNNITVSLPSSIYVSDSGLHEIILTVSEINNQPDTNIANNSTSFSFSSYPNTSLISINLELDCWGSETSWEIADDLTGNILWSVPENTYGDSNNGELINESVCLSDGCYDFNIYDSYGDGMFGSQYNSCNINGNYYLTDQWNMNSYLTMSAVNADFGSSATHPFCVQNTGILSDVTNELKLYPNPSNNILNINFNTSSEIEFNGEMLDLNGKIVHQFQLKSTQNLVDISLLKKGFYLIKINNKYGLSNIFSFIKN